MPKKKKKNPKANQHTSSGNSQHDSSSVERLHLLQVKLSKSSGSNRKSLTVPSVSVSQQDAERLLLSGGQDVFLVSNVQNMDYPRISLGRVEISSTSYSTPKHGVVEQGKVMPGTVAVAPSWVAKHLFPESKSVDASVMLSTPPKRTVPPSSTPATTCSNQSDAGYTFSFKIGGGGEWAYSSPYDVKRSPTLRTPTNRPRKATDLVWLIPGTSRLGSRLRQRLCRKAVRVSFRNGEDCPSFGQNSLRILQRLILAHCVGRHIQVGERIRISFQGKPLWLEVEKLEGSDELSGELDSLHIKDDDDDWSDEERLLSKEIAAAHVRLYKMTHSTIANLNIPENEAKEKHDQSSSVFVAGLSTVYDEMRSLLLSPLERRTLFLGAGLKPPRGVLLHGPSGVGKSLLAKKLAADLRRSFEVIYVQCSQLQSMTAVVGQAERELTRYFASTDTRGKVIIFDDVHMICAKRGGVDRGTDRLAATLLAQLDGVSSSIDDDRPVVVVAITNNPSLLDPAIRRPGRLDAEIEVPLPDDPTTRADIMKCVFRALGISLPDISDAEWLMLGKIAKGFNGADCALAVKGAVQTAILRRFESESMADCPLTLCLEDLRSATRLVSPSAIKSITVEIPKVKWSSIGGMDVVKRELREAIEAPMIHQETFSDLGIPAPRGILLYGPPGCSKTLMARALATEGQMNFLAVKGPELLSKWLGESERALASLFRRARMASPSIIFFDEIDAIATSRGIGDSPSSSRLLSQLLTELDGINHTGSVAGKRSQRVVVVGATNRPDLLDKALTRPGRIDRMIYVATPDRDSRAKIFEISLSGKHCSADIDIPLLSSDATSEGFSGAEIVAICRDAALLALEEYQSPAAAVAPQIEMRHLLKATTSMKRQITPEMIRFYETYRSQASAGPPLTYDK